GWDAHAAWDDLRLGLKINSKVRKIAIVGELKWESWMSKCISPFVKGEMRYFDLKHGDYAMQWLQM
ncbi:MAG: STAS/SEC14 domain-containing protein, partial [Lentisphaeraceae bacterium]|nr:STAS/SEC14 domain-containing protein [Lentisphaeraceae bacterium]